MMSRTNASNEDHRLNRNHKDIQDITVWINYNMMNKGMKCIIAYNTLHKS